MGYLVLARKYRPQTFGEMSGQEHVVRTLSNALASGRLAHAFLFTGPRGVGKTTAARLVAKAVNCEKGPTASPCGACVACVEIAEGRSVDVIEIDAASNNGVDNVRDIVEGVKYRPARDKFKVFVVDEVHMLSTGAFNALLKTLEEPPAARDLRAGHHRRPQGAGDHRLPLPALRLPAARPAPDRGPARQGGRRGGDEALRGVAGARGPGRRGGHARRALAPRPGAGRLRRRAGRRRGGRGARRRGRGGGLAGWRRGWSGATARRCSPRWPSLYERGLEMRRVAEELVRFLRDATVARLAPGVPLDLPEAELARRARRWRRRPTRPSWPGSSTSRSARCWR